MNRRKDPLDTTSAWLADVQSAWAAGDLETPPIWVTERAKRIFRTAAGETGAARTALERLRATLVFDSRQPGPAPAGIRAATAFASGGPWQLLYRGGDVDVDLLVRPNQDGHTAHVRGQALSLVGQSVSSGVVEATPSGSPRKLRGHTQPAVTSRLEPTGEFALPNLERGRYDVLLRLGAREIELNDVEL